MNGDIPTRLQAARRELLDLGLRNPLLNYRNRTRQVAVIDEKAAEVYRRLVTETGSMTFEPLAEEAAAAALAQEGLNEEEQADWSRILAQPGDEPNASGLAARHRDALLQTSMVSNRLQARLLSIHRDARSYIEEQGVNILFLALGLLHWFESPESEDEHRAPLVLVPVELVRDSAQERFRVKWTGEDIEDNLSLVEKLKSEFGIQLPELPDTDELDVGRYFADLVRVLGPQSRWKVMPDETVLGFFSFGKFLMYRDLDPDAWSQDRPPGTQPILASLLGDGFAEPASPFGDEDHIDAHVSPSQAHQVIDADSSQTLALLDINAGRNLVLQGPPGTGKSQTITNVIAEAIGNGRRVLFVAEKMAALEVVKRRLDQVGLGDAVLELHSHKTNKRHVIAELDRTLRLGRPKSLGEQDDVVTLVRLRDHLNEYCEAVNAPIGRTSTTFVQALGLALQTADPAAAEPAFPRSTMREWRDIEYKEARLLVEALDSHLTQSGPLGKNPFRMCALRDFLPSQRTAMEQALAAAQAATEALLRDAAGLALAMGLPAPADRREAEVISRAARRAMEAPHLEGLLLTSGQWQARRDDLARLVTAGRRLSGLHARFDEWLIDDAWRQDLLEARQHQVTWGGRWWRFLSSDLRRTRARLQGLCRKPLPRRPEEVLALIDAVLDSQKHQRVYEEFAPLGQQLFGAQWKREGSDWDVLEKLTEWVVTLYREVGDGHLPRGIVDFLSGAPTVDALRPQVESVEMRLRSHAEAAGTVAERLSLAVDPSRRVDWGIPLEKQAQIVGHWRTHLDGLYAVARFNRMVDELGRKGLDFVVPVARSWQGSGGALVRAFDHAWYTGLVETAYGTSEAIGRFDRAQHEHYVKEFSRLDELLFRHNRTRLALSHWKKLPPTHGGGEVAVLLTEINKRRRHLPVRRLIQRAPGVIQGIKPIFMMSPMSVATFLSPGAVHFDLVVFDETSQVKPVDAFGALMRGTQAVVVGDSRQLPPTNFFQLIGESEGEDVETASVGDMESILSLFLGKGAPERMLRWHYRSRHESLIAVSNHEFYDNRLMIFPSPGGNPSARGLQFHYLSHTAYEPGRTRTNPLEAEAVAKAVMAHARTYPDLSLGVVAFSVAQRDAIELRLEVLRRSDPSCETFFQEEGREPFFVKNLENVQGDERDVIFISIGYGKTKDGYLPMRFGPLNLDGGERRLNVLISRARLAMDVFGNFMADEMDLSRTNARGVHALHRFLAYARSGQLELPERRFRELESPFEEEVMKALVAQGVKVEPQVGTAGFFIDLAVCDPERPGRYLLGVECDGATYHSARSARDRDRLRQAVLEGLGWRLYRVWSTDWYRSPEVETRRLLEAIEDARARGSAPPEEPVVRPDTAFEVPREPEEQEAGADSGRRTLYQRAQLEVSLNGRGLHEVPTPDLATYLAVVVECESPVHWLEAARRIADGAGVQRTGSRIQAAIQNAIEVGVRKGAFKKRGDFLWSMAMQTPLVRDRSDLEAGARKIEFVAPEELEMACLEELRDGFSMDRQELVQRAARRIGIDRVSGQTRSVFDEAVDRLAKRGQVIERESRLFSGEPFPLVGHQGEPVH